MRTGIRVVALAAAVALIGGTGAATPAAATTRTWTVRPGGKITATGRKIILTDTRTGSVVSCESGRSAGTLKPGSGLPGAGIGSLTTGVFTLCQAGPFGATVTARGLPWRLNLASYDRGTGVARGTISHLELSAVPSAFSCTAVIKGTAGAAPDGVVPVSYATATGTLTILPRGSGLRWYHVHGCAGIINNGDAATLSASYRISPRQVIASP